MAEHCETDCVEFFRNGAPLYGGLACSGIGQPLDTIVSPGVNHLSSECESLNKSLLSSVREDPHADALMKCVVDDSAKGRMTAPMPACDADLAKMLLHPRFSAAQEKADGSIKVRPIDHFSYNPLKTKGLGKMARKRKIKEASINGHCVPSESIHHDHLDVLLATMTRAKQLMGRTPAMFKADIDSAYRRIPICKEHWWAAAVVFFWMGQPWVASHRAMPFGALAAVHAWERIGALITKIAVKLLKLVCFRYVDDFFGCERPELVEHSLSCLVRLIRLLLGPTSVADSKVECGSRLIILGVDIKAGKEKYTCMPSAEKVKKWIKSIEAALANNCLPPGDAGKLAGRLSWSCQHMFHRMGRAMLRPLFMQKHATSPFALSMELRYTLLWWKAILLEGRVEKFRWEQPVDKDVVHLFCDAAGNPARIAAVAVCDGKIFFTDCEPPEHIVQRWASRSDSQIMGLELLSIALAFSTFGHLCKKRRVIVHSDNTGAECCLRKGTAKHSDHCHIVNELWGHVSRKRMQLWIQRVGTDDNWSDSPSRFLYDGLVEVGATECKPRLAECYEMQDAETLCPEFV